MTSLGLDGKRRLTSRPSSTVSYTRGEHIVPAAYAPSPAPHEANTNMAGAGYLTHVDAMEQFNVRGLA